MAPKLRLCLCGILIIGLLSVGAGHAGVPSKINYQLKFTDPGTGETMPGSYDLLFGIYASASAEDISAIWSEPHAGIAVDTSGVITVVLGTEMPITDVDFDRYSELWLGVWIKRSSDESYSELRPRRALVSVPYAFQALKSSHAADADNLGGLAPDSYVVKEDPGSVTAEMLAFDVVRSINGLSGYEAGITLKAGENIAVGKAGADTITISATAGGDITSVMAGEGLAGGGDSKDVILRLADEFYNGSAYDAKFVNTGEENSVTGPMIQDGAITDDAIATDADIDPAKIAGVAWTSENDTSGSGLDADLLDGKDGIDFASADHNHDSRYYTQIQLSTSDGNPPNQGSNLVSWDVLGSVPTGLADGIDDVGPGDGFSLDAADGDPQDAVYVNQDGDVGIRTKTPGARLTVSAGSNTYITALELLNNHHLASGGQGIGMEFQFDTDWQDYKKAEIRAIATASYANDIALTFWSGGSTEGDHRERMRIKHDGYVGIGTASPGYRLDVAGSVHASSFPTSSDSRFKTDIREIPDVLNKLDHIRGVTFEWNGLYESLGRSTAHREIGVIAQEVEEVFPELVTTWGENDYRSVDYGRLAAVLVEAVKALKAENEQLRLRVEALESSTE